MMFRSDLHPMLRNLAERAVVQNDERGPTLMADPLMLGIP